MPDYLNIDDIINDDEDTPFTTLKKTMNRCAFENADDDRVVKVSDLKNWTQSLYEKC
jgi:hypothetical protein